ncbi:protein STRUBBELIG-RECEPTOR FAMILY 5-like [Salvia miltiorrhiza]|uniref:protein STRUBBELIG-RECEPTOR FAMILY 5-like n=1 Tax=Salvia miltiorrhiza TaxID=226208 RepID=UPI0025AD1BF2|nr:protein STRUBBELIG-RECEPTOR FAMILY 5-like [Salvia miltiorrhiza]XP_057786794.1 protein STRUBBELIG-RECEPTOR FAMILY 5-like [Salvia miltiorrhiza]XP_057786795.1 protein STRUBBELIG-RECEPTOR FAMILY 5-like [Salvia miltiorrhiza]
MQLEHWKEESGDPCAEPPWTGVQCIGSSIIDLKLHGLGLTGSIGFELSNLKSLKKLDLSSNDIEGSIPYSLPPNLTHLNFAENKFSQSFPYSIEKMKHLQHLFESTR